MNRWNVFAPLYLDSKSAVCYFLEEESFIIYFKKFKKIEKYL
jgi:hypothetical protein